MTRPVLERVEWRFRVHPDVDPIPTRRAGRGQQVLAHIHPADAVLRIVDHPIAGLHVDVTGDAVHDRTGKPNRLIVLTQAWEPGGAHGHDDLAEAPDWVRDTVADVIDHISEEDTQ